MRDPWVKTHARTPGWVQVGAERTVFILLRNVPAAGGKQGRSGIEASVR